MIFRDFHILPSEADYAEGKPIAGLKKDTMNFVSDKPGAKLKVTINATYSGYLLNRRVYPGKYLRDHDCFGDWCSKANGGTASYDKPVLTHHNDEGEPIGRVVASKFFQLWEDHRLLRDYNYPVTRYDQGSGYIQVIAYITDKDAIAKILDGRYNTVSSSQDSDNMFCSICGCDYRGAEPCTHLPGQHYEVKDKQKLCYVITGKLRYLELSYVNVPANANAMTVAKELSDSMEQKSEFIGCDHALRYHGISLLDAAGQEIDLSNRDGDNFPVTKTQVHIDSDIDLDKLCAPAAVSFPDGEQPLDAETFAIGNVTRSLLESGQFGDGPMSGMVSYFKAISGKADGHQHIIYLQLDMEGRRLQGGTEYTSKGEHHHHSVDLEIPDLNAKSFKGETRDADRGDHHVHTFEFDMVADREAQVAIADALRAAKLVNEHLRDGKLTTQQILCLDLTEEEHKLVDAKLSTAQRKKLKESTFCGPNRSFPVPDCAHVTAARRLIGRFNGSADTKARILSCVNTKAKSMGCDKGDTTKANPYGMLHQTPEEPQMPTDEKNKTPAGEKKSLRDELAGLKDVALLDKAVQLADEAIAKDRQIVDLNAEKDALKQKNATVEASSAAVTKENGDLRTKLHRAAARELAVIRLVLGEVQADTPEKFEEVVSKLAERTEASLADATRDSLPAFQKAIKSKTPDPAGFLKKLPEEKAPTAGNGDPTGDKDAQRKLADEKAGEKDPAVRKAEASKKI